MREILFRGKRADNGEWIFGGYAKCNNRHYILPDIDLIGKEWVFKNVEVIPETVGQYIGLTDKNGTKIFEGDIMVFLKGATRHFKIAWDDMGWKMYRADGTRIRFTWECDEMQYICSSEVIGNIHDNPELLED